MGHSAAARPGDAAWGAIGEAGFTVSQYLRNEEVIVSADDSSERCSRRGDDGTEPPMLHSKACPRCTGDLALVQDVGDTYLSCVQCGYLTYQVSAGRPQTAPALVRGR
jgi:ribosomal protein S27AE